MPEAPPVQVAIVDYGLGNLFSVQRACEQVGILARITAEPAAVLAADAVILPGVGAFGDAMATLRRLRLVDALREVATAGKPLMGICLGFQLLMEESFEFGRHEGLGVLAGKVVPLAGQTESGRALKVPEICWNSIHRPSTSRPGDPWDQTPLQGIVEGEYMYFVHSYVVEPADAARVLSRTRYGDREFCSSVGSGSLFACQFHPERSGTMGLQVYTSFARRARAAIRDGRTTA